VLKLNPKRVSLISAFTASKGVSSLDRVKKWLKKDVKGTHKSLIVFLNTDTEGREALRLVKAFWKSAGRVTFWSESRLGILN
jgi:hypothetical protein